MINKLIISGFILISPVFAQQTGNLQNDFLLGQSYEQAGDFGSAKKIFESLLIKDPQNHQFFTSLNRIHVQLKEFDKSIALISNQLKIFPQNIDLYGMLGVSYYLNGDERKAFQTWDDALASLPQSPMNYRIIANYAIERRAFDKATEIMQRGKAIATEPLMFSYDLANIYAITMRFREAAEEYCHILENEPKQLRLVEQRILSYMSRPNALEQTIEVFEKKKSHSDLSFTYILARLYTEKKDFQNALSLYIKLDDKQNSQGAELYNFANSVYNEGEYQIAGETFSHVISKYPESPVYSPAKLGIAKTLEAILQKETFEVSPEWKPFYSVVVPDNRKVEKVLSAYDEIVKLYPYSEIAVEALLRMGRIKLYKQNEIKNAISIFERIIDETPLSIFSADAYIELAKAHLQSGDLNRSESYLRKVIDQKKMMDEKSNHANYLLAMVKFYQQNFKDAKDILSKNLENLQDNSANDAIYLALMINPNFNDSVNLKYFSEAEFLAGQKKFDEAREKYGLIAANPQAFVMGGLSRLREAEMHLALDRFDKSIPILEEISSVESHNIYADKALYLLAGIFHFGLRDYAKAIEIYEKLLAKFPASIYLDEARNSVISLRNKLS